MKLNLFYLFASLLLALSSCDSSPSTGNTPPDYGGNTFPKSGSSYTYDYYMTDSNGNNIETSRQTQTATVVAENQSYMGKTKVFQVEDNGANNYYTYEHNGDVDVYLDQNAFGLLSAFLGASLTSQWYMFPITSHYKGLVVYDSTITISNDQLPLPLEVRVLGTIGYIGEEQITVKGETFTAQKCKLTITGTTTLLGTLTAEQQISFIPKLGYIGKQVTTTTFPAALGVPRSGDYRILTSYTLAN